MRGIEELENAYEDYMYMASGLKYEHQESMRNAFLRKAEDIKEEIREAEKLLYIQYKDF